MKSTYNSTFVLESDDDQVQHGGGQVSRTAHNEAGSEPLDGEGQRREIDGSQVPVHSAVVAAKALVEGVHVVHQAGAVRVVEHQEMSLSQNEGQDHEGRFRIVFNQQ